MASSGYMDMDEYRSRIDYMKDIIERLFGSIRSDLLPTAIEEQYIEEVLKRVVRVVSSDTCTPVEGTSLSSCMQARGTTMDRKQCLTKILSQLKWMDHERLYSPPADNEIGYYLLIKKYMRSILAFFSDSKAIAGYEITEKFGCVSRFTFLHPAEELAEVNQHLAEFSEVLLKCADYDFMLKPIMAVDDNSNIAPSIRGSKEKSYEFYFHKLMLAFVELRCSEHAYLQPREDEKTSYVQLLDSIAEPLIGVDQDGMSVDSGMLNQIFLERLCQETKDIMRHFAKIKSWILKNLSLTECWETIINIYDAARDKDYYIQSDDLVKVRKALAEKCKVSNEDLLNYISRLDCFITIVDNMIIHVMCCLENVLSMLDIFELDDVKKGWEALHVLTLLKRGSYVGNVIRDNAAMRNLNEQDSLEHVLSTKSQNEKVLVLRDIIEDLKFIGDSNVELDEEELALVQKIWVSVASSTHFFISALAYEQKRYMSLTQRVKLFDVNMLKLRTSLRKKQIFGREAMEDMDAFLTDDMHDFASILKEYKIALVGPQGACFLDYVV